MLFVGLGVDFGIQFSVRYRAERHASLDLHDGLLATARGLAGPLLLAAASITAAFYSFLPTAYLGLSELGLIAGTGIIVAFATTVTLLPALLTVLKPAGEAAPIGYAALAPLDRFLEKQRKWVVGTTLAATILGLPLLTGLRFDFNPLNLRAQDAESISTLLDLMRDPDTSPNTLDILATNLAHATSIADRLRAMPEVARVLTLQSFVPKDQDAKLAIIDDASCFLRNTPSHDQIDAEPTSAETVVAIEKTAYDLGNAAGILIVRRRSGAASAGLLAAWRKRRRRSGQRSTLWIAPLITTLPSERSSDRRTCETSRLFRLAAGALDSTDGQVRIEVAPGGWK